jgi:PAS domain S-box-containing protein
MTVDHDLESVHFAYGSFDLHTVSPLVLEALPCAVTVTDPEGRILYFNKAGTRMLDRRPEYLGRDIRLCHKETESIEKIDRILSGFHDGHREPFSYQGERGGDLFQITVSPILDNGRLIGCLHTVIKLPRASPSKDAPP